jgi:hypothetical protein
MGFRDIVFRDIVVRDIVVRDIDVEPNRHGTVRHSRALPSENSDLSYVRMYVSDFKKGLNV